MQPLSRQLTNELLVKIENLDNNPTTFVVGKCTQFVREEQYFFAFTHNKAAMNSSILYDNDLLVGKLSSIIDYKIDSYLTKYEHKSSHAS